VDHHWAQFTIASYRRAATVTGDPLVHLPPEAVPHIRAAAALTWVWQPDADAESLDAWVGEVADALELRATEPHAGKGGRSDGTPDLPDLWGVPRAEAPASVSYLGTSRRAVSQDPDADLAICVLEALARARPAHLGILAEGTTHTHSAVRWTAERLLSGVGSE
jgi:hypothetical protein